MKTIKAARLHSYGGPEAMQVECVPLREPRLGELLVRVHAAGLNPMDWKIRAGYLREKMPLELPVILGGDFSGVVEAAGPDVAALQPGDLVYGDASARRGGSGAFAQFVIAQADNVAAKPRRLDDLEAAALPLTGVSALQALTEHLKISAGQSVLIHGGAGGIGRIAIQLAKHFGARVATTVGAADLGLARELGAEIVLDYRAQKFEDVLGDLDAVFDTVGGDTYVRSFKVLRKGGRLVSMLEQPRQQLMTELSVAASILFTQVTTERLNTLSELVDRGALNAHVDKTFPLREAATALGELERRSVTGRAVLTIGAAAPGDPP
jgi:NADPH:quinone reductase-like Zn-dependent oxidoreductase